MILGKCPPEPDELKEARQRGFSRVELYLETKHLDDLNQTMSNIEESDVEVVSVHTPHVPPFSNYIKKADKLAEELDAYLVFHTKYMHHTGITEAEEMELKSDYGYENNPGNSVRHLEALILSEGHDLVLDIAHLFMAEENYLDKIRYLLENYGSQIKVLHLCDSSTKNDGLGFGEGDIDMRKVSQLVDKSFDGLTVLEVMPEEQEKAYTKWKKYTQKAVKK